MSKAIETRTRVYGDVPTKPIYDEAGSPEVLEGGVLRLAGKASDGKSLVTFYSPNKWTKAEQYEVEVEWNEADLL